VFQRRPSLAGAIVGTTAAKIHTDLVHTGHVVQDEVIRARAPKGTYNARRMIELDTEAELLQGGPPASKMCSGPLLKRTFSTPSCSVSK
jgi:hypothetical protein